MKEGSYRFKLGDFDCVCLSDGGYEYKLEWFFENVPEERVKEVLRQHDLPTDRVRTPYTYLFVDMGTHRLLIDIGAGNLFPTTGKLPQSMKAAGIDPAGIDTVAITHAHPDHVGGMVDEEGNLTCPNARYFVNRKEWDFWFSKEAFDAFKEHAELYVNHARKAMEPIRERVELLESVANEPEILPGVSFISAPGHTPGHVVVAVSSKGDRLYYIGDTVLYPLHLEYPDWLPVYDIIPEEAESSKRLIFDRVADEKALVVGQHFPPFPSLGHVEKRDESWRWQPIEAKA